MWAATDKRSHVWWRGTSRAPPLRTPAPWSSTGQVTAWARDPAPPWSWRAETPAPTGWGWPAGLPPTCPDPPGGTGTGWRDPWKPARPVWDLWSRATGSLAEPRWEWRESPCMGCSPPWWDCALSRQIWSEKSELNDPKTHFSVCSNNLNRNWRVLPLMHDQRVPLDFLHHHFLWRKSY